MEEKLKNSSLDNHYIRSFRKAKKIGFTDAVIARYVKCTESEVKARRQSLASMLSTKWLIPVLRNLKP